MKKKIIALSLCVTMVMSAFSGCGAKKDDITLAVEEEQIELTFSWWGSDERHEYTIEAVKAFEAEHPNIKVNLEYSEFTGFQLKTDVKMKAHTEADVMQLNYVWLDRYSSDGNGLYDLNKLKGTLNLGNYTAEQLAYGNSNGILNALPIALNGKVFLYNEDLYKKYNLAIPKTWDDLFAAAEVMKADDVYPLDLETSAVWFLAVAYVEQNTGRAIISEDNHMNFTRDDIKAMIEFYVRLVDEHVIMEVSKRSDSNISNGTCAGTLQWITSAEKYSAFIEESGGKAVLGNTLVAEGATRTGWYVKPATMYAISANTEHPKEAAELLEFLVSSEKMTVAQGLDKGVPSNQAAKAILQEHNLLAGLQGEAANIVDQTKTILMSPYFEDSKLQGALKTAGTDVIYGESDIDTAADTAFNTCKSFLDK